MGQHLERALRSVIVRYITGAAYEEEKVILTNWCCSVWETLSPGTIPVLFHQIIYGNVQTPWVWLPRKRFE